MLKLKCHVFLVLCDIILFFFIVDVCDILISLSYYLLYIRLEHDAPTALCTPTIYKFSAIVLLYILYLLYLLVIMCYYMFYPCYKCLLVHIFVLVFLINTTTRLTLK